MRLRAIGEMIWCQFGSNQLCRSPRFCGGELSLRAGLYRSKTAHPLRGQRPLLPAEVHIQTRRSYTKRRSFTALIRNASRCAGLISTLSSSLTMTDGTASKAVRAAPSQAEPCARDTRPSGMASQPTGGGLGRVVRAAQTASGTSIRTR